jgi:hypothetical protein
MRARRTQRLAMAIALTAALVTGCSVGTVAPSATSAASGPAIATQASMGTPAASSVVEIPTTEPSSSTVSALGSSGSGAFGPGTYATAFQPPLTFTLADQTIPGANGTIAYESIGEVDVNLPAWVDISFGFDKAHAHGHGTWSGDFGIDRIDKVFEPRHAGKVVDPPKDLAAWIETLPGVTLTAPPWAVKVGGLDATQIDIVTGDTDLTFGPIPDVTDPPGFGFGPHQPARIVVVTVDKHAVLITLGGADSATRFKRVVAALQPLVESIVWH